jgi:hypothetical protein
MQSHLGALVLSIHSRSLKILSPWDATRRVLRRTWQRHPVDQNFIVPIIRRRRSSFRNQP